MDPINAIRGQREKMHTQTKHAKASKTTHLCHKGHLRSQGRIIAKEKATKGNMLVERLVGKNKTERKVTTPAWQNKLKRNKRNSQRTAVEILTRTSENLSEITNVSSA